MFLREKVDAVYELRDAVERKVRAEVAVESNPTRRAKDALLDATLNVETQTQRAIEVCHSCGRAHRDDPEECSPESNVLDVDFRPDAKRKRR